MHLHKVAGFEFPPAEQQVWEKWVESTLWKVPVFGWSATDKETLTISAFSLQKLKLLEIMFLKNTKEMELRCGTRQLC